MENRSIFDSIDFSTIYQPKTKAQKGIPFHFLDKIGICFSLQTAFPSFMIWTSRIPFSKMA
jgi:hypothetical protein